MKKYVADKDCMYKGRFVSCGSVIEAEDGKMNHSAFSPYDEKNAVATRRLFDPTEKLATARQIGKITRGLG